MEKKLSEMTAEEIAEYEDILNNIARHQLIKRMLADILTDMTIARDVRHTDPMEFPIMIKQEIDKTIELWKQKELARGANGNTTDTIAKNIIATNTESLV